MLFCKYFNRAELGEIYVFHVVTVYTVTVSHCIDKFVEKKLFYFDVKRLYCSFTVYMYFFFVNLCHLTENRQKCNPCLFLTPYLLTSFCNIKTTNTNLSYVDFILSLTGLDLCQIKIVDFEPLPLEHFVITSTISLVSVCILFFN